MTSTADSTPAITQATLQATTQGGDSPTAQLATFAATAVVPAHVRTATRRYVLD